MALTADQLNTIYQNVLFRNVDSSGLAFFANRTDISDAQVRQQIELSGEANTFVTPIVRLYQEVLGRVPDVAGLRFYSNALRTGSSIDSITQAFLNSSEFTSKSSTSGVVDPSDLSNTNQLVRDAFQSILGRAPADSEFAYFQGRTAASILSIVSTSNEATQTNAAAVTTFLDSAAQGTPNTGSLNNQTGPNGSNGGLSLAFTTSPDNLTGTGANDTFTGVTSNGAANTFSAADRVSGGAGTDTLRLVSQDTATGVTVLGSNVTGIETLAVTNVSDGTVAYTVTGVTGLVNATNDGSNQAVTIGNLGATGGTYTVQNTAANTTFTLADAAVTGATDTANVALNNVTGAAQVNINSATGDTSGFETIAVTSTGASSVTLETNDTSVTRLSINASAATTLALGTNLGVAATIDGSASTAGLTVTGIGNATTTITGGAGNDLFGFGANFTTADIVNGGAGTDFLGANAAQLAAVTAVDANVTNIEGIFVQDDAGANATINLANFGVTANLRIAAQTGGEDLVFNGLASGANVRFDGGIAAGTDGNGVDLNVTNAALPGQNDVINLDLRGGAVTYNFNAPGVETLNVTATNDTGTATLAITDTSLTTLNLTSTNNNAINTGTLGAAVSVVNAGGVTGTGGVTITLSGSATTGATVTGSAGGDVINGSQLIDVINSGAGNDTITAGAGADRINVGTGTDIIVQGVGASGTYTAPATNTISTATFDIVTGMGNGDQIDLTDAARTLTTSNTLVGATPTNNTAVAIRGTYDATAQTFVGSASGADTLFAYDADATGTTANEAIVLVGYVNTATATSTSAGVFTLA